MLFRSVDADAGVAFFFGKVKVALQVTELFEFAGHVGRLGFDFLNAEHVGAVAVQPFGQAFGGGGADAVQVEAGEFEQGICLSGASS